jgi:hypothetical protein
MLEGFKGIAFMMVQITCALYYLLTAAATNIWKVQSLANDPAYYFIVSCNIAMEVFNALSAFMQAYSQL